MGWRRLVVMVVGMVVVWFSCRVVLCCVVSCYELLGAAMPSGSMKR